MLVIAGEFRSESDGSAAYENAEEMVAWGAAESTDAARVQAHHRWPPILLGLLLTAGMAWPGQGAQNNTADTCSATPLLQRSSVTQGDATAWPSETVQIEASLPKLKKTGRLQAIRRLFPARPPDYKVLEIAGDPMVTHQVILRYMSADEQKTKLPALSVALTNTNYKIRYAGSVESDGRLACVFRIIPRKKRAGLINGVLWLDAETGVTIRESGYLAKNPSVFVKRINLTRENELHDGTVVARTTYVSVDTRLVGRAQLVIVEHPLTAELTAPSSATGGQ